MRVDDTARLCVCGHPADRHWRERGNCLHETSTQTWACPCPEYRPALATVLPEREPSLAPHYGGIALGCAIGLAIAAVAWWLSR